MPVTVFTNKDECTQHITKIKWRHGGSILVWFEQSNTYTKIIDRKDYFEELTFDEAKEAASLWFKEQAIFH